MRLFDWAWIGGPGIAYKLALAGLAACGLAGMILVITVPLDLWQQLAFGGFAFLFAWIMHRIDPSRRTTLVLAMLSMAISTRYLYWRITETLKFDNPLALTLGMGLFLAEIYAWVILVLGYYQCIWPLARPIRQISGPPSEWPTVDVFVPTYNESLDIVQDTVLAAMSMDYPAGRFKVYILDDGRRPEFERFARAAGCGYIIRPDNKHAKAGNLNHALTKTDGELICVFDADHVATRAFLQLTVGWFQADPKLALLQTPHYFYSPDPVQRNIGAMGEIQGEGSLFYGVVQEGNDFWNAAFFCGSCAIIRREALTHTNGFAGETVTEDAHTALKLQRMGWNTAYLNVRLSAGLATERLAIHIGQRARWARGMTQIMRIDCPLWGKGLSLGQRLCYLNAMLHFQFPLPRIVFLTSPLCYLLLGQNIIHASPLMIAAYAGPHLIFSSFANSRVQNKYGRALWSEVYETILAFQLVGPAILPLFNPKAGKFNVTDKGGLLKETYFDWRSVKPQLICIALLVVGCLAGITRMFLSQDQSQVGTTILNLFWSLFSLVILGAAVVVARETRQVRTNLRAKASLPVTLYFEDGHMAEARTIDVSMGGIGILLPDGLPMTGRVVTHVELNVAERLYLFPTTTLRHQGSRLALRFGELSLENRRGLVRVVFGRADAWPTADDAVQPTFLSSFRDLVFAGLSLLPWFAPTTARQPKKGPTMPRLRRRPKATAPVVRAAAKAAAALVLAVVTIWPGAAYAQRAEAPATSEARSSAGLPEGARNITMSLKDMGVTQPLQLISTLGEAGIPYNVRADEVVTRASLTLNFAYSPQLLPDLSHFVVAINNEVIASVELVREGSGGVTLNIPIDPGLFTAKNRLNFRFIGHYTRDCEDPLHTTLWANVSNTRTKLNLTLQRLSLGYNLSRLPAPFFDESDQSKLRLPFVFLENPSNRMLAAAGTVASYFGMNASYRGFAFPVGYALPTTDAVVIARSDTAAGSSFLPAVSGPTVMLVPNPRNRFATLLVIGGRTDDEVMAAARTLAVAPSSLSGRRTFVRPLDVPARKPYDAPRWLQTEKPARLGDVVAPELLEGQGLRPGVLSVPFRTPPDLFFWPRKGGRLSLGYRYPGGTWLDYRMSRLDVLANGKYLRSFPLTANSLADELQESIGTKIAQHQGVVDLPAYNLFSNNQLQFFYDLRVAKKGRCQGEVPGNVRTGIDASSKLDLSKAYHYARLPDLAFFTSSGFPYTRMADQSATVTVMAPTPTPAEIETYLTLMGRMADSTGLPTHGTRVVRPGDPAIKGNHDLIVIGSTRLLASMPDLVAGAPIEPTGDQMRVRAASPVDRFFDLFGSNVTRPARDTIDRVLVTTSDIAGLMSWTSPYGDERIVTALFAANVGRLPQIVAGMADEKTNYRIQGDVAIASAGGFTSARVGDSFWTGDLPIWIRIMWWSSGNPVALALVLLGASAIFGTGAYFLLKARERKRLRDLGGVNA